MVDVNGIKFIAGELIGEKEDYYNIVFAGHALDIDSAGRGVEKQRIAF